MLMCMMAPGMRVWNEALMCSIIRFGYNSDLEIMFLKRTSRATRMCMFP